MAGIFPFPVAGGVELTTGGDSEKKAEPGTIMTYKNASGQFTPVQYVQLDNNGCSKGECLCPNNATIAQYSVKKTATTDGGGRNFAGVAMATIASQYFGWMAIGGYVEFAYVSQTPASGEYLGLSASTAGQLTNNQYSAINLASALFTGGDMSVWVGGVIGLAKTANATGLMSIALLGWWGV